MSAPPRQVDVVGIGQNACDTLIRVPDFPAFNSEMEYDSAVSLLGGQIATAAIAYSRWGLQARYVGTTGDDSAGQRHADAFQAAGVDSHIIRVPQCQSQTAFILVDGKTGERTILWRRDPRLALRAEHLQRDWVIQARLLHVDAPDAEAAAMAAGWARQAGILVLADVDRLYAGLEALLRQVDFLVMSTAFPEAFTGEADLLRTLPALAKEYGCKVTAATLGTGGVIAWDGHQFHYAPAFEVEAVDTTGAGDLFHAAFGYAVLAEWPLPRILEFSCAAAALNCTAMGARGGIRPVTEIEGLMRAGRRRKPVYDGKELQFSS